MLARIAPQLGIIVLAFSTAACVVDAQVVTATGEFDRTLAVSGPIDLEVQTGSGSIDVRRGAGAEVRVVGRIRAHRGFWNARSAEERIRAIEASPPITQAGNTIRIGQFENHEQGRNVSISYELTVPAETRLRARTGSGSHRIDAIAGPVEAETGSGSIQLGSIGGAVRASTGSGSIDVLSAGGGLNASTGSGSIRAQGVRGPVRASSGSGRIAIEGTPTADWSVDTGSGGVTLRLPADASFELSARSSSGRIETNHPLELRGSMSRQQLQGRVRSGGPRIEVSTGSGGIRLE